MLCFCCGAERSGSTLQYNISAELLEHSRIGIRQGFHDNVDLGNLIKSYRESPSSQTIIVKTHSVTSSLIECLESEIAVALYCFRDIRDVIVSMVNKFGGSVMDYIQNGFIENYLERHNLLTQQSNVYVSQYESFYQNVMSEIIGINRFLKTNVDSIHLKAINDQLSIKKNKSYSMDSTNFIGAVAKITDNSVYNSRTLLHKDHIQSGEVNQFMHSMSLDEIRLIEEKAGAWLAGYGYNLI